MVVFGLAGAVAGGCASNPPLQTEASTSGIHAAEEVGAADVPQAALHLQLAKEELESAKAFSQAGEKERASSMLGRSEADAELAVALSHKEAEREQAQEAMARVRELREDNQLPQTSN